jgi:hypothetical protein
MEDELNTLVNASQRNFCSNGRQPYFFCQWKTALGNPVLYILWVFRINSFEGGKYHFINLVRKILFLMDGNDLQSDVEFLFEV